MFFLRRVSVAFMAATAVLGAALFMVVNVFYKRRVIWTPKNYYSLKEEEEERRHRQVLVLGLDGAGKSSVLQGLNGATLKRSCAPTRGFNFMRLHMSSCKFDFLEIGGGEDLRVYWADFLNRAHILLYVVDSSDRDRLLLAKDELHHLLRLNAQIPVVILGNKQDKPNAVSESELHAVLSLGSVADQRKLYLIQMSSEAEPESCSLQNLQNVLVKLV